MMAVPLCLRTCYVRYYTTHDSNMLLSVKRWTSRLKRPTVAWNTFPSYHSSDAGNYTSSSVWRSRPKGKDIPHDGGSTAAWKKLG